MTGADTFRVPLDGGVTLAARADGAIGKPWVVLAHALGCDMSLWDGLVPALTATHRVLRYDARGHGASDASPGPYSFDGLAGDMVAVMDHAGVEQADIIGLSMGGMTALGIALGHPGRVRRIVCANARAAFPPAGVTMWSDRAAAVAQGGMAAVVDDTLARWFVDATRTNRPEAIDHARRMILATSTEGYRGCAAALGSLDYLDRLGGIGCPALYIAGEFDGAAPPEAMATMAAATPEARFELLAGVAHISVLEAPDAFAGAVTAFLAPATA